MFYSKETLRMAERVFLDRLIDQYIKTIKRGDAAPRDLYNRILYYTGNSQEDHDWFEYRLQTEYVDTLNK